MGRYVWYAEGQRDYLERLFAFIASEEGVQGQASANLHLAGQMDPLKRTQVEQSAQTKVEQYYRGNRYHVEDISDKNLGWDLTATRDDIELFIEVKGGSGRSIAVELTANEYKHMKKHRDKYRVCIVTEALSSRSLLSIYAYNPDSRRWEHQENGTPIRVQEVVAARLYV